MRTLREVLRILDYHEVKYTHHHSLKYITLVLPNGVALDFSLGGTFNGRYYESRLKRVQYMEKTENANSVELRNGNLMVAGLNLPLCENRKAGYVAKPMTQSAEPDTMNETRSGLGVTFGRC